jgi:hypothetical protein
VGIQGLMDRLTTTFKTRSHAGIFEEFWGRGLLWQRAQDEPSLTWIPPGKHKKKLPPSWSWMAVHGSIDFLNPPGGEVQWNKHVVLPFPKQCLGFSLQPNTQPPPTPDINGHATGDVIHAIAFSLVVETGDAHERKFSYDDGKDHDNDGVRCVIIADTLDMANHYVLLITSAVHAKEATHERIGAGYMSAELVDRASGIEVTIG